MTNRQYYAACVNTQDAAWLRNCAANPSPQMTRVHVRIAKLAARKLSAK